MVFSLRSIFFILWYLLTSLLNLFLPEGNNFFLVRCHLIKFLMKLSICHLQFITLFLIPVKICLVYYNSRKYIYKQQTLSANIWTSNTANLEVHSEKVNSHKFKIRSVDCGHVKTMYFTTNTLMFLLQSAKSVSGQNLCAKFSFMKFQICYCETETLK